MRQYNRRKLDIHDFFWPALDIVAVVMLCFLVLYGLPYLAGVYTEAHAGNRIGVSAGDSVRPGVGYETGHEPATALDVEATLSLTK